MVADKAGNPLYKPQNPAKVLRLLPHPLTGFFILTKMKTYYIKAIVIPNGIDREMDCGLLVSTNDLASAFVAFQDHYEEQWGVGIAYQVTDVIVIDKTEAV